VKLEKFEYRAKVHLIPE